MGDIPVRQVKPGNCWQQDDPHRVGSHFRQRNRFRDARASFQRAGRRGEQRAENREGRELSEPDREARLVERVRDRIGKHEACERDERRDGGAQHRRVTVQPDLGGSVIGPARDVIQQHQRGADPESGGADAVEAEGGHQIAEAVFRQHAAENDQHDELRRQPEHAGAGAHCQDGQIRAKAAAAACRSHGAC